jgi:hypothetical protein
MFIWHEGTASRGSQEVAPCLLKFYKALPPTITKLTAYSDNDCCVSQNRNQNITVVWLYIVMFTHIHKLAVQSYRVLNSWRGYKLNYLNVRRRSADLVSRQHLRSSASGRLEVPAYKLNIVGRRSFAVASPLFWNTSTGRTNCADAAFRARLQTFLFWMLFYNLRIHLFR